MKDRILQIIEHLGVSNRAFEIKCGLSNGYINSMRRSLGLEKLENILKAYPEINREWLISGEGPMLKTNATEAPFKTQDTHTAMQAEGVMMIPLLNLDARGGLSYNEQTDVAEYIEGMIPFRSDLAKKGDFAMIVSGDSMYPRYPSGSYLLLREIPMWREYMDLSVPYLLELNDGRRIAKIVCKGEDKEHYVLKSANPEFQDTEISITFISRVFMIVASLKKEIM